jgi:chorismate mutase / prephenate dehydratase
MTQNQHNKACDSDLSVLRCDIDNIDEQIISLLKARMEVVKKVGELKEKSKESFFIRSNREADMIKNLVQKSQGILPKATIVGIWRKIITAANMLEQPLKMAIHNPKNVADYEYLVRDYYDNSVPIQNLDSVNNVVLSLEKNEAQIGIFALPEYDLSLKEEGSNENWWIALANNRDGLKIFAKIPFIESRNSKTKLVAVAKKNPEKSSDDNSLFCVETSSAVDTNKLVAVFEEQNLKAKVLKSVRLHKIEGVNFYLIEAAGFWLEEDEAVKNLSKTSIKPYVKVIGHYAKEIF